MAVTRQQLAQVLCCHAWDPSQDRVAVCPNSSDVHIYAAAAKDAAWPEEAVLRGHDDVVTGVDWSVQGRLVTCSQDRSASVWQYDTVQARWTRQRVGAKSLAPPALPDKPLAQQAAPFWLQLIPTKASAACGPADCLRCPSKLKLLAPRAGGYAYPLGSTVRALEP